MASLLQRYTIQQQKVKALEKAWPVKLLAVSKTRPAEDVAELYRAGQRDFGENYLQEALQKQRQLAHYDISWHFIGPIQSNKTRDIAGYFSWVHSVDRLKIAQRLNQQRPAGLPKLNICLQVNIDKEASKSGFYIEDLAAVIEPVLGLKNISLRGLMAIPKAGKCANDQANTFKQLADVKQSLNNEFGLKLDTLSMGMSSDMAAAINEGATMVRIGTAIFGARLKSTV